MSLDLEDPALAEEIRRRGPLRHVADLLTALGDIIEEHGEKHKLANEYLGRRGLQFGEVLDLITDVAYAEREGTECERGEHDFLDDTLFHPVTQRAVAKLWARGFDADQISFLFNLDYRQVKGFLEVRGYSAPQAAIIEAHVRGLTVVEIARELNLSRSTVHGALVRAELTPNVKQAEAKVTAALRARIWADRQAGAGYAELREKYGLSTNQVRKAIEKARAVEKKAAS